MTLGTGYLITETGTRDTRLHVTSVRTQTHVTLGYLSTETDTRDTRLQVTLVQRHT